VSGMSHDTAARLIGIPPGELEALVKAGHVPRIDKNSYSAPALVHAYIDHIRAAQSVTEAAPKQAVIAEHLDMSERAVREFLEKVSIDHKKNTLTQIRLAYIQHMREVAAGRAAEGGLDLAAERAQLARAQRERIEMQNAVTRGDLAPRSLLTEVLARTAPRICGQLDSIVPALRRRSGYSADDLDFVAQTIADARNAIASMRLDDVADVVVPDEITEADLD